MGRTITSGLSLVQQMCAPEAVIICDRPITFLRRDIYLLIVDEGFP